MYILRCSHTEEVFNCGISASFSTAISNVSTHMLLSDWWVLVLTSYIDPQFPPNVVMLVLQQQNFFDLFYLRVNQVSFWSYIRLGAFLSPCTGGFSHFWDMWSHLLQCERDYRHSLDQGYRSSECLSDSTRPSCCMLRTFSLLSSVIIELPFGPISIQFLNIDLGLPRSLSFKSLFNFIFELKYFLICFEKYGLVFNTECGYHATSVRHGGCTTHVAISRVHKLTFSKLKPFFLRDFATDIDSAGAS